MPSVKELQASIEEKVRGQRSSKGPEEELSQEESSGAKQAKAGKKRPANYRRDRVTGRPLAENSESCLRCAEKGLKCTLNFVAVPETDAEADTKPEAKAVEQCAACRRSGAAHCVRELPPLTADEAEELLRDHFEGAPVYAPPRPGSYLPAADAKRFALPPYNGSDRPVDMRPENWKSMDWRRVLPIARNRSFHERPVQLDGKKSSQRSESLASSEASLPTSASASAPAESSSSESGSSSSSQQAEEEPQAVESYIVPFVSEDTLDLLTYLRKYQRRRIHLREYQRDLEETA
ncbi:hypothetical protein GGR52DRAFT_239681 [Hypoxylon sp. FL1284]|nr:hypothetical protein GGR52DRAFT_239681 [Hypoxylon sp. FL1284]